MNSRRPGTVMASFAVGCGALALVATAVVVGAADGTSPSDVIPGSRAQAALSALAAPSVPQPLPGSRAISPTAFRYEGGCEAMRSAYQAPDAPVPPGTVVSIVPDGGLRFAVPFGRAAAFVRDEPDGACTYELRSEPTWAVAGPGLPADDGFQTVACFEPFGVAFLAVIEIPLQGGGVRTVTIGQSAVVGGSAQPEPFEVASYLAPAASVLATNGDLPVEVTIEALEGSYDSVTRSGTVSGEGPGGAVAVDFRCTVGNFTVPGL
ncbi:MAG: hypothetical protein WCC60_05170 [Ilumatobacteraceae bacterium]